MWGEIEPVNKPVVTPNCCEAPTCKEEDRMVHNAGRAAVLDVVYSQSSDQQVRNILTHTYKIKIHYFSLFFSLLPYLSRVLFLLSNKGTKF